MTNLILLTCALLFINSTPKLVASCYFCLLQFFGLFLAARFLFLEILNLNLTFRFRLKRTVLGQGNAWVQKTEYTRKPSFGNNNHKKAKTKIKQERAWFLEARPEKRCG